MCARGACHTERAATCPPLKRLYLRSDYRVIYLFSFSSNSSLTLPSNFLITNPFASKSTPNRQAEPGGETVQVCTHPHLPDQGQHRSKKLCMCKKVDLGTRIAEFVYRAETPQLGCQSYQELQSKLSPSTRTPGAVGRPESADWIREHRSGGGRALQRVGSTCSRCRSPPPSFCL